MIEKVDWLIEAKLPTEELFAELKKIKSAAVEPDQMGELIERALTASGGAGDPTTAFEFFNSFSLDTPIIERSATTKSNNSTAGPSTSARIIRRTRELFEALNPTAKTRMLELLRRERLAFVDQTEIAGKDRFGRLLLMLDSTPDGALRADLSNHAGKRAERQGAFREACALYRTAATIPLASDEVQFDARLGLIRSLQRRGLTASADFEIKQLEEANVAAGRRRASREANDSANESTIPAPSTDGDRGSIQLLKLNLRSTGSNDGLRSLLAENDHPAGVAAD
jgi:hypothetical protein